MSNKYSFQNPTIIAFRSILIEVMVEWIKIKLHLLLIKLHLIEEVGGDISLMLYCNNRVYKGKKPCRIRKHDMCVVRFLNIYEMVFWVLCLDIINVKQLFWWRSLLELIFLIKLLLIYCNYSFDFWSINMLRKNLDLDRKCRLY